MVGSGLWSDLDYGRICIMVGSGLWSDLDYGRIWIMVGSGLWLDLDPFLFIKSDPGFQRGSTKIPLKYTNIIYLSISIKKIE